MPLLNCQSTNDVKKEIYIPEINFPKFPVLEEYEQKDGKIIVPEEYILQLAEYKIRIEETEQNYNEIKKNIKEE